MNVEELSTLALAPPVRESGTPEERAHDMLAFVRIVGDALGSFPLTLAAFVTVDGISYMPITPANDVERSMFYEFALPDILAVQKVMELYIAFSDGDPAAFPDEAPKVVKFVRGDVRGWVLKDGVWSERPITKAGNPGIAAAQYYFDVPGGYM